MRDLVPARLMLKNGTFINFLVRPIIVIPIVSPKGEISWKDEVFGRPGYDSSDRMVRGVRIIYFRNDKDRVDAGYHEVNFAVINPGPKQTAKDLRDQFSRPIVVRKKTHTTHQFF